MKKYIVYILCLSILVSGCSIFTKNKTPYTNQVDKGKNEIAGKKEEINRNENASIKEVAKLSSGISYTFTKTNSNALYVAKELNDRITSLVGIPDVTDLNDMKKMVDHLTSELQEDQKKGIEELRLKDEQIAIIQKEKSKLKEELEDKRNEFVTKTSDLAKRADQDKSKLNELESWFGLGAVFYGIKKFIGSSLLFIIIFGIIFLVLRILSNTNPIAKAAFSIFEMIGGMVVSTVKKLIPGSINLSNLTHTTIYNNYKQTLHKLVDSIEEIQNKEKTLNVKMTLDEVLVLLDKKMNDDEKELIKKCKTELNW